MFCHWYLLLKKCENARSIECILTQKKHQKERIYILFYHFLKFSKTVSSFRGFQAQNALSFFQLFDIKSVFSTKYAWYESFFERINPTNFCSKSYKIHQNLTNKLQISVQKHFFAQNTFFGVKLIFFKLNFKY